MRRGNDAACLDHEKNGELDDEQAQRQKGACSRILGGRFTCRAQRIVRRAGYGKKQGGKRSSSPVGNNLPERGRQQRHDDNKQSRGAKPEREPQQDHCHFHPGEPIKAAQQNHGLEQGRTKSSCERHRHTAPQTC
ncbi:hypothetical protein [Slackia isoflavoniconvertens]|uniref:hypothetical protein n=1 Tax=Slackia isoflavoniconvertens TaxID=572010 RepID=UPI003AEF976C